MRNSARKQLRNRSVVTRLNTLEKKYNQLASEGKKAEAATALKSVVSALDKAAKSGTIPKTRANRKRSRLTLHLNKVKQAAATAA
jgi:small subunit ribosomal protein S20